jgi:hypothetical protein
MKCRECGKVAKCVMRVERNEQDKPSPFYLCARDAREWDKDHEEVAS